MFWKCNRFRELACFVNRTGIESQAKGRSASNWIAAIVRWDKILSNRLDIRSWTSTVRPIPIHLTVYNQVIHKIASLWKLGNKTNGTIKPVPCKHWYARNSCNVNEFNSTSYDTFSRCTWVSEKVNKWSRIRVA